MEISLGPPRIVLLVAIALPAFVTTVILLAGLFKRMTWRDRLPPIVFSLLVSAFVLKVAFASRTFAWTEQGIRDDTFGSAREVAWTEIEEITLVEGFRGTPYRPTLRVAGAASEEYGSGTFALANGNTMRVFFMAGARDALVVRTRDTSYLYAPVPFEPFLAAAQEHCPAAFRR